MFWKYVEYLYRNLYIHHPHIFWVSEVSPLTFQHPKLAKTSAFAARPRTRKWMPSNLRWFLKEVQLKFHWSWHSHFWVSQGFHGETQLIMWNLWRFFEMTLVSIFFARGICLNMPWHHESNPQAMQINEDLQLIKDWQSWRFGGKIWELTGLSFCWFGDCQNQFFHFFQRDPPENERMSPEKGPFQKGKTCLPTINFQEFSLAVSFREE